MGKKENWSNRMGEGQEEGRCMYRRNVLICNILVRVFIINIENKSFLQLTQTWQSSSSPSTSNKEARPPEVHAVMINMHPEELPLLCDVPSSADVYLLHLPSAGISASLQERCGNQTTLDFLMLARTVSDCESSKKGNFSHRLSIKEAHLGGH